MTQGQLIKGLSELVDVYGAARIAVELHYRSDRSITVWLANKNIPRARRLAVKKMIIKFGNSNKGASFGRNNKGQSQKTV